MTPRALHCVLAGVRVLVLGGVFWLVSPMSTLGVTQGEWVTTGPPIDSLAVGGSLVILADGAPLLFGLDAAAVQMYFPNTATWAARGGLVTRRVGASVTVLPFDVVLLPGGSGQWDGCAVDACLVFGQAGDVPVVGDWTGTGQTRIGVFRNGGWALDLNGNGQWDGCGVDACIGFGLAGDRGVVGNW